MKQYGAVFLGTAVLVFCLFYLTPLKHLNLVEPGIDDIEAKVFNDLSAEDPEKYLFIDVRSAEEYWDFHAEGSINMPIHTLFDQRHNLPKQGKTIVLICSGGRLSGVAYHYLEHFGFLNLKRIDGGVKSWQAAGLPTVFSNSNSYGSQ